MRGFAAALACLALSACIPPTHSSDYSVPFARSYWSTAPEARPAVHSLTVEQLYALNQYGRRAFHPWRTMAPAFGCRGAEAVPFLKTKITPRTVGSLLELFLWMRWMGTYEPTADADLMQRLKTSYDQMPKTLRKTYASDLAQVESRSVEGPALHRPHEDPQALQSRYCMNKDLGLYDGPGG